MICLIVMIIFGILGIFSASHRKIAGEAFRCVFRQATFRKCDSGMDIKIKSNLVGKLMKKNPKSAKIVYKNFELLSWIFTILMIGSLIWSGVSVYNLVVYDNCNGQNSDDICILSNGIHNGNLVNCGDPLCEDGKCTECGDDCDCQECNDV